MARRNQQPKPSAMITLRPGCTAFSAWMRHYRENGMAGWARYCELAGYVQVVSDFPNISEGAR